MNSGAGSALTGKVVVVTGAGRGIGRAISLLAAREGARVVVADVGGAVDHAGESSDGPATEVVEQIVAEGGIATAGIEDVSTSAGAARVVATALAAYGRIDAMVCCAGILDHGPVHEITEQQWNDVIDVHLGGHFACTSEASRAMIAAGVPGRIVHFSSASALKAPRIQPAYAAAKAGVIALTSSSAKALAEHAITVNCILPGASTRMTDKVWDDQPDRVDVAGLSLRSEDSAGTWRDPANVAPFVVHLLRDEAATITGAVFAVVGHQITTVLPATYGRSIVADQQWTLDALSVAVPGLVVDGDRAESPWPPPVDR